jgi:phosphohistidine phosphatase
MELYLMRHGEAENTAPDSQRRLTATGAAAVERVAARAAASGLAVAHLYHSGLARAQQTAEILARHLNAPDRVEQRDGLRPNDPVEPTARWLLDLAERHTPGGIALVGHLPFMGHLAARLVAGDERTQVVAFEAGALVKLLPRTGGEGFTIAWVLTPELA